MSDLNHYDIPARDVIAKLPTVLAAHGLDASAIRQWLLTDDRGLVVLFAVVDVDRLIQQAKDGQRRVSLEQYISGALLHDLSTLLGAKPVAISNSNGLRYGVVLSELPRMPEAAEFPGLERGQVLLGLTYGTERVALNWETLGHVMTAGMTGSGKSTFLRLLAHQALSEGFQLALVDVRSTTFPMLANHPALIAPVGTTLESAADVVKAVQAEMDRRERLFAAIGDYPDNLSEYNRLAPDKGQPHLPRLVVILDEYNDLLLALGGPKGELGRGVTSIALGGRKWGVNLIIAGHEFQRESVGMLRGQLGTRLCFRVEDRATAAIIVGPERANDALAIRTPGRAIMRGVGTVQTFRVDKRLLIASRRQPVELGPRLTEEEQRLGRAVRDNAGPISIELLTTLGLGRRAAERLVLDWDERGWTAKDPTRKNGRYLTAAFLALLGDGGTPSAETGETAKSLETA